MRVKRCQSPCVRNLRSITSPACLTFTLSAYFRSTASPQVTPVLEGTTVMPSGNRLRQRVTSTALLTATVTCAGMLSAPAYAHDRPHLSVPDNCSEDVPVVCRFDVPRAPTT
ncbi:hypothetical protein GCM10010145_60970 [Streptomyces ruber]|uniref:Uncharacterized protein n=1 Tax=Streptomyces ruber TaxID=83378 RepID=A0A918EYP0_9ACTN|nr:hypothetical protein GCM10010145_60970 [Streptomyces ruber]